MEKYIARTPPNEVYLYKTLMCFGRFGGLEPPNIASSSNGILF